MISQENVVEGEFVAEGEAFCLEVEEVFAGDFDLTASPAEALSVESSE